MIKVVISSEDDIVTARTKARHLAAEYGFSMIDKTRVATAVSELARNTLNHGGGGHMEICKATNGSKEGIRCLFRDQGPGIPDIEKALADGFSTRKSMGHGLPGARRLVDEFKIDSQPGAGTEVEIVKWA